MESESSSKPRLSRPLTETQIRNAKATSGAPKKLAEPGGLFLLVKPGGTKLWRLRFRLNSREGLLALGSYPEVSLAQARELQRKAKAQVAAGLNPVHARARQELDEADNTFGSVTSAWQARANASVRTNTQKQREREVKKYLLPKLAAQRLAEITRPQLTAILAAVEGGSSSTRGRRPAPETARNLRTHLSAIFEYAIDIGVTTINPTPPRRVLKPRRSKHHKALPQGRLGEFLRALDCARIERTTRIAMLLVMLTACRKTEVTSACWNEFDLTGRQWNVPAERMKAKQNHWVPLSQQSITLLEELRTLAPVGTKHLFPNRRDPTKPMADRSLNAVFERLGFGEDATPHGMRALFSTHFNAAGANPEVIERCLAHAPLNKIRAAYNRHEYQAERRTLLESWADHLDQSRTTDQVHPTTSSIANSR